MLDTFQKFQRCKDEEQMFYMTCIQMPYSGGLFPKDIYLSMGNLAKLGTTSLLAKLGLLSYTKASVFLFIYCHLLSFPASRQ